MCAPDEKDIVCDLLLVILLVSIFCFLVGLATGSMQAWLGPDLFASEVHVFGGNLDPATGLAREKKEYGADRGGRLQVLSASSQVQTRALFMSYMYGQLARIDPNTSASSPPAGP
jgi:hypothetical protein